MAFKIKKKNKQNYSNPIELLNDLSGRKVPGPLHIQGQVLTSYTDNHASSKNVSIEMPTGTGKTLVAVLIAEWRRIKYNEKVLYLCPTKQLAFQTFNEANDKYGIKPVLFTGSKSSYSQADVLSYAANEKIAISTYNSLFNTNPFFKDLDIIIIDDAHSAESSLASVYSLSLNFREHQAVFENFLELLKPILESYEYHYYKGDVEKKGTDSYLLPLPRYYDLIPEITKVLDEQIESYTPTWFPWSILREKLHLCNIFLSYKEILIRPFQFPLSVCTPYTNAKPPCVSVVVA